MLQTGMGKKRLVQRLQALRRTTDRGHLRDDRRLGRPIRSMTSARVVAGRYGWYVGKL